MENKTAMQTLIEWGDKMMLEHPMKTLSFAEVIDKAQELLDLEKEQIKECWDTAHQAGRFEGKGIAEANWQTFEQYYNERYNK